MSIGRSNPYASVDRKFTRLRQPPFVPQYLPKQTERGFPKVLAQILHFPPAHAWIFTLFWTDIALLADVLTGPDVWLGPAYLFVICVAAWGTGCWGAHAVGLGCLLLTFFINGQKLYPNGSAELGWNLAARIFALSLVVALICALKRGYVREWWLARTDSLSGALNRQAFFELGSGLAADHRNWRLLIYADLDGLKQVNDQLGHAVGDSFIRDYAESVNRAIRRGDLFARMGGDEFIIFMPVRNLESARSVAGRLHSVMNSIKRDERIVPRCSVGALFVPPGSVPLDELVRRADELMYVAKLRGACLEVGLEPSVTQYAGDASVGLVRRRQSQHTASARPGERRGAEARRVLTP